MPHYPRPPRAAVEQSIQALVRGFRSQHVTIRRGKGDMVQDPDTGEVSWGLAQAVYRGEALLAPAGGTVQTFGLGQVEAMRPTLLIAGTWDIQQGDFVDLDGQRFQVEDTPNMWHAFLLVRLGTYQQAEV